MGRRRLPKLLRELAKIPGLVLDTDSVLLSGGDHGRADSDDP